MIVFKTENVPPISDVYIDVYTGPLFCMPSAAAAVAPLCCCTAVVAAAEAGVCCCSPLCAVWQRLLLTIH